MAGTKPRHAAVLALIAWLMMPPPLRAAGGPIAVPGTADVETWYLMEPAAKLIPYRHCPSCFHGEAARTLVNKPLPAQPLPGWMITKVFPTRPECEAELRTNPRDRCISADDPRLKKK
jgi:hypothetical protein